MAQRSPRLSTRRVAPRIGLSRMQVWRTLREDDLRGLLEKYPTFGREKETGLLGALDT